MIAIAFILVVALVLIFWPVREKDEPSLTGTLHERGYELWSSKPDANGYCMFRIIEIATGKSIADIDRACTLDEAFAAARRFVAAMEKE